jgi:hypothetical protein
MTRISTLEGSILPALTDEAVKGKLTRVNVFASWCILPPGASDPEATGRG